MIANILAIIFLLKLSSKTHLNAQSCLNCTTLFEFQIPSTEIGGKTVVFGVFDFDRLGKHDMIGEIRVPMNEVDLGGLTDHWKNITFFSKVRKDQLQF